MAGGMEYEFAISVSGTGELLAAAGAAEEFEHAMDGARDANAEFGASTGEAAASVAAEAAGLEAAAASVKSLRDEHTQLSFQGNTASAAMRDYRRALADATSAAADAERGIGDLQNATSHSEIASIAAAHGLRDIRRAARDAGDGVGGLEKEARKGGGILSALGAGAAKAASFGLSPMAGLVALVAGGAAGALPAVLSLGGGFAAFGAMAAPALYKVKTGLSEVAYAQQQYQMAKGIEARNPTRSNLENEQRALAQLKTTWAQIPKPVRGAVSEIRQFGRAWSQASRRSGLQKDALGDIKSAVGDAKELIPVVTGLGKAAQPVIHDMLGDLGKEFKSKGFLGWIHNLKTEMKPAYGALKSIGGAMGGFITQLTGREAKPGTAMLKSIGTFLHTITPGTVTGLTGLTKGITGLFDAMNSAASSKFMSKATSFTKGLFHAAKSESGMAWAVLQARQGVLAKEARVGYSRQLEEASKTSNLKAFVHARIKVKTDGGDVRKQIEHAAAGKGGTIPVKGKVTLSGLKAGIQQQIKGLHIPDSKVKVSIQVTGAGAARAAMGQVVSAAKKDAAGAAAALGGLGAAGSHAGAALSAGLASGINAGAGAVAAAARHVAGIAASAIATEAEIHSPSKKTERLGRELDAGLVKGLLGGEAEISKAASMITGHAIFKDQSITAAVKRMRAEVRTAFRRGDISGHQRDSYIDFIDRGNKRLMNLAQQRAKIEQQIHAATALAASVTQNAIEGGGGIVGFGQSALAAKNAGKPSGTIQEQQQEQLSNIKKFRHEIIQLKREGLDKRDIRDIEKAGITGGGMATAEQLLGQGPAAIKQTAKLEREIEKEARKLGVTGANAAYESGSQIGKGLAAGLRSELKGVEQAMAQLARQLINELRKDMGLPPLPKGGGGKGGGGHHGKGHGGGLGGGGGMQMYPGGPPHRVAPIREHPGDVQNHIHVNIDGREVATVVQTYSLRRARRNTATGLKLANRGI